MASNTSQRKAQATILASHVEDFRTWYLIADCGGCGQRAVPMSRFPVNITMRRLVTRLRCQVCRKPAATVAIGNAAEGHTRRVLKVWGAGGAMGEQLFIHRLTTSWIIGVGYVIPGTDVADANRMQAIWIGALGSAILIGVAGAQARATPLFGYTRLDVPGQIDCGLRPQQRGPSRWWVRG